MSAPQDELDAMRRETAAIRSETAAILSETAALRGAAVLLRENAELRAQLRVLTTSRSVRSFGPMGTLLLRLCAGCGDVVGAYEPCWVERPDGSLRRSSLLHLSRDERDAGARVWHAGCADDDPMVA